MQENVSPEEACLSQAIRLPLDVLIDISISYRKAGVEALAADPGDENLQALAVVAENTSIWNCSKSRLLPSKKFRILCQPIGSKRHGRTRSGNSGAFSNQKCR